MIIPFTNVTRIVVLVHPGSLKNGELLLITLCDSDKEAFEAQLNSWKDAICLYDGPPMDNLPLGGKR